MRCIRCVPSHKSGNYTLEHFDGGIGVYPAGACRSRLVTRPGHIEHLFGRPGKGGNLLPFAEIGYDVTGVDISEWRIQQARTFFESCGRKGLFVCKDFLKTAVPKDETERYDVILMHDVIEHIAPGQKEGFLSHARHFLSHDGVLFIGFPAWQMPFGGHQQIVRGLVSKLPYVRIIYTTSAFYLLKH